MLQWIHTKAAKLGFGVLIRRPNNGSDKRLVFVTFRCKTSDKYITTIWKLKQDDNNLTKCECPFKLHGNLLANNKGRFNVICDTHNHDMCHELVGHLIASHLMPDENEIVSDMTLNMVLPKNILANLKRKRPKKYLKYQTSIQCPYPKQQGDKRRYN
ncbi:uncharacterized protein LOC131622106 [Vicia villosa]|uniref:uncharacterized protein LOC131622106 n=1 Tax=Vicia villosa TaxID=3911 RepID=UPI00273C24E6|nr:uncharacterized protein LOC131622106 [Vicia villosa]